MFLERALAKNYKGKTETLKEHTLKTVKSAIEICKLYGVSEEVQDSVVIASLLHDMGKLSCSFQKKIYPKEQNGQAWIRNLKGRGERHEIYSLAYMVFVNDKVRNNSEQFNCIKAAILFTHYGNRLYWDSQPASTREYEVKFFEHSELDNYELERYLNWILSNKDNILNFLKNILNETGQEPGRLLSTDQLSEAPLSQDMIYDDIYHIKIFLDEKKRELFRNTVEIMGLVKKSDHAASAGIKFESTKDPKIDDLKVNTIRFEDTWQYELAKTINNKRHLILVAPTGSGKSEFALAFHKLVSRKNKMVFILPLRAALDQLYKRYNNYLMNNVDLLHSTAFIQYLKELEGQKDDGIDIGKDLATARLFIKPYTLCTPDQSLLTSLKVFGFDNILTSLGHSTVVIDEIQAYTPEMTAIILSSLEQIHLMGGKLLIMTATMPLYMEKVLNESADKLTFIRDTEKLKVKSDNEIGRYELEGALISTINTEHKIKNATIKRHKLEMKDKHISDAVEDILKLYKNHPDKRILVIVNTIGVACKLYKDLKSKLPEDEKGRCGLLHARIIEKKKQELVNSLSPDEKNPKSILISTQVLEASADIDADYLFTQLSPLESQIQRWGRVYRNRNRDYGEQNPNVFIYKKLELESEKDYSYSIYDKEICNISDKTISSIDQSAILSYIDQDNMLKKLSKYTENIDSYVKRTKQSMDILVTYGAVKRKDAQELFRRISGKPVFITDLLIKDLDSLDDQPLKRLWNVCRNDGIEKLLELQAKISDESTEPNLKYQYLRYIISNSFNVVADDLKYRNKKEIMGIEALEIPNQGEQLLNDLEEYGWCKETAQKFRDNITDQSYII